jgi:hypothetical protein
MGKACEKSSSFLSLCHVISTLAWQVLPSLPASDETGFQANRWFTEIVVVQAGLFISGILCIMTCFDAEK